MQALIQNSFNQNQPQPAKPAWNNVESGIRCYPPNVQIILCTLRNAPVLAALHPCYLFLAFTTGCGVSIPPMCWNV